MGEFTGGNSRVRCIDCAHLSGKMCSRKNAKVAPRKRRICAVYNFKGEYENRETIPGRYMPPLDKKTRRFLKRMYEMGISPVVPDQDEEHPGYKRLPMPASTATAKVLGMQEADETAMTMDQQWGPDGPPDDGAPNVDDVLDNPGNVPDNSGS